jgi:chromosome segregation ATPase
VARLAKELTADLSHAADVNARLRADLESALTALRHAAEEARQDGIERERLAVESQSRAEAARRLEEELQLVEAERDGALGQVARLTRELRDEKLRAAAAAEDVRKARAEAAQAQEDARRISAELGARTAELDQANAGIESMGRDRDSLAAALLAARAEADEAAHSRTALEEIHRALDEARVRVAKIR